ncbi:MAG: hypothetical protein M3220_06270 [Chloroflexota bacterium]|nr:hypothetical protein [Chloroflexota bacterium]
MIDLHCHILPDVDDGAPDWEGTLAMMAQAAEAGTRIMVATPHSHDFWRGEMPCRETIVQLAGEAQERAVQVGLELQVLPGQECLIHPNLVEELEQGKWLTLAGSKTLLLELPFSLWPPATESLVFDLQQAGYTILLAHPERYSDVAKNPNLVFDLVEKGVYTQVTRTSIMGAFGNRPREVARLLLEHGLAHVLASDAHTTRGRNPRLADAYSQVREWIGETAARRLVVDTPRALLRDEPIEASEPRRIEETRKKRTLFGWFD